MASDAYSGSGGWSGGSPLQNTGQVLGSYMQKVKTYDPASGGITTATPTTVNTPAASSSLARVVNPPQNQVATAATPAATTPVQSFVAPTATGAPVAPAATNAGMALAPGRDLRSVSTTQDYGATPSAELGPTQTISFAGKAGLDFRNTRYVMEFRNGQWTIKDKHKFWAPFSNERSELMNSDSDAEAIATANRLHPELTQQYMAAKKAEDARMAGVAAAQQAALSNEALTQQMADAAAQRAALKKAQDAVEIGSAFSLAGQLQDPNTSERDAAGYNDLARVASQYSGYGGGMDAGFYNSLGQRDLTTQASVNKVAHDTAYAQSVNANYNTFVNALKAQQQAAGSATAARLQMDMQGVADALSQVQSQVANLGTGGGTKLNGVLVTVRDNLQKYQNAVKAYGADSAQAMQAAQLVLGGASGIATAGV